MKFDRDIYYGHLVKGNLTTAIKYLQEFPEQMELYDKYLSIFRDEEFLNYEIDSYLNKLLLIYQKYYREVFYLHIENEVAIKNMCKRFSDFFGLDGSISDLSEIEDNQIALEFQRRNLHFMGGKTGGYYGPYVWRTTKSQKFNVLLPDCTREYVVNLLEGFVTKSWLDFISLGKIGSGGWTNDDGLINCIKDSYDLSSENFLVSLLKHEAQHASDLSKYPNMSSQKLEYRAKLVELIYSKERNLLIQFMYEADNSHTQNGHSMAAHQIITEFTEKLNGNDLKLSNIPTPEIQAIALELFEASNQSLTEC